MDWTSETDEQKVAAWRERFDEAFQPVNIRSETVDRALAFEGAVPGISKMLDEEFNRIAPPGSPILKQGLHVPEFYSSEVKAKLALAEKAEAAVPEDEEYKECYNRAMDLADAVMEAVVSRTLCAAEYQAIVDFSGRYTDEHMDDGISAIAHTIYSTTEIAQRHFLAQTGPRSKPAAPRGGRHSLS